MQGISMVNSLGQTVRTIAISGDKATIDLQGLVAGVYILRIVTEHGIVARRIMVQ